MKSLVTDKTTELLQQQQELSFEYYSGNIFGPLLYFRNSYTNIDIYILCSCFNCFNRGTLPYGSHNTTTQAFMVNVRRLSVLKLKIFIFNIKNSLKNAFTNKGISYIY